MVAAAQSVKQLDAIVSYWVFPITLKLNFLPNDYHQKGRENLWQSKDNKGHDWPELRETTSWKEIGNDLRLN
jgi:hypothetical protein